MLGESLGNGVVVAPPQKLDPTLWDEITVAAVVAPPAEDKPAMSIDQVIQAAMTNMKQAATIPNLAAPAAHGRHKPAQMLRIRYHEKPSGRDWIEQLVFIEGPDQEIYSVALKARPDYLAPGSRHSTASCEAGSWNRGEDTGSQPASSGKPEPYPPHY